VTLLDDVLIEEYERSKKIKAAMEKEISQLPQGYISKKLIHNKSYFYIQKRKGPKIISSYISTKDLPILEKQIIRRKQLEMSLKEVKANIKKIERVIK
jgi:hypothetical protein